MALKLAQIAQCDALSICYVVGGLPKKRPHTTTVRIQGSTPMFSSCPFVFITRERRSSENQERIRPEPSFCPPKATREL